MFMAPHSLSDAAFTVILTVTLAIAVILRGERVLLDHAFLNVTQVSGRCFATEVDCVCFLHFAIKCKVNGG